MLRQLHERLPSRDLRGEAETMRALREEAERLKIEMNDECDCSGVFYDGDVGSELEARPCRRRYVS